MKFSGALDQRFHQNIVYFAEDIQFLVHNIKFISGKVWSCHVCIICVTLASHMFWTVWALLLIQHSVINFDIHGVSNLLTYPIITTRRDGGGPVNP